MHKTFDKNFLTEIDFVDASAECLQRCFSQVLPDPIVNNNAVNTIFGTF